MEIIKRGFLGSGNSLCSKLGITVVKLDNGAVIIDHPGYPNHKKPVPYKKLELIDWNKKL